MGCGRVGSTLAVNLSRRGHSVAIIDQDSDAFRRLPDDFDGQQVTGVGFDRDALIQAGIEDAQGFAAVSNGDNSNIIAARVVRDTFNVKNVVARIYDSSRADIYERLGISTVPTVKWTADRMMRRLIQLGPNTEYVDSMYQMALFHVDLHESWYGVHCEDIERNTKAKVAYVGRGTKARLARPDHVIQDGDVLYMIAPSERTTAIQRILNHAVQEDHL